jgi:predicted nuclease with TOPRIM domain
MNYESEKNFIESLMDCNNFKEVNEIIAESKDLLRENPGLWNHVFSTKKRIKLVEKEKSESFKDLLN